MRDFFADDIVGNKVPADIPERLFRKLQRLDDAKSYRDLRSPSTDHCDDLSENPAGMHSIRVNDQWRLVFQWDETWGEVSDLYLDNRDCR